jgi:hypothetical protein
VEAADAVQDLMESRDDEKVKFAIAILSEGSLPIATNLMTSESCRDRMLGLTILVDMWSVVAIDHIKALNDILACPVDASRNDSATSSARARPGKMRLPLK